MKQSLQPAFKGLRRPPRGGHSSRERQKSHRRDKGTRLTRKRLKQRAVQTPLSRETKRTESYEACRHERPLQAQAGCRQRPPPRSVSRRPTRCLTCQHQLGHARGTLQRSLRRCAATRRAPRRFVPRPAPSLSRGSPRARGEGRTGVTAPPHAR